VISFLNYDLFANSVKLWLKEFDFCKPYLETVPVDSYPALTFNVAGGAYDAILVGI
jgi:hypothetical protein